MFPVDKEMNFLIQNPVPDEHFQHPSTCVILPVYRCVEVTRRCILSAMPDILATKGASLLVINDASPDEGMQDMLAALAARWPGTLTLLENAHNLGFVKTVNRGLSLANGSDVVLLNSDVVVPPFWLSRLQREAYERPRIGTVTPFSNNATICSFPNFIEDNALPFGLDVDAIDAVFREHHLPCVEAPTGVGFCMYIRWACLEEVGLLNEEKFGLGYGEENDFCQRSLKRGWLNLISPNIFVFHEGGVSFSTKKSTLVKNAMRELDRLHPNYHADVQMFIRRDALMNTRLARYVQLISTLSLPKVLHVSHELGGGVGQHVEELAEYYNQKVVSILITPCQGEKGIRIRFLNSYVDEIHFRLPEQYDDLVELLRRAGVNLLHYHHAINLNPLLLSLSRSLNINHILSIHDFYLLNANPTLTNDDAVFTGDDSDEIVNNYHKRPPGFSSEKWRQIYRSLVEDSRCVVFPSRSTRDLFGNRYDLKKSIVSPHIEAARDVNAPLAPFAPQKEYTVGVLGALSREKGADYLEKLALHAQKNKLPFKFKLIGYAYRHIQCVAVTGPYKSGELSALIKKNKCDLVFFPAQWPETYSYTLSYALASGLPIVAPNIGALAERLRDRPRTLIFPARAPVPEMLEQLCQFIERLEREASEPSLEFFNESAIQTFYEKEYLQFAHEGLIQLVPAQAIPLDLAKLRPVEGLEAYEEWRERLLGRMWKIYVNPRFRWISHLIPFGVRRAIKRMVSRKPLHEITNHTV